MFTILNMCFTVKILWQQRVSDALDRYCRYSASACSDKTFRKRAFILAPGSAASIIPLLVLWINPTAEMTIMMAAFGVFGLVSKFPSFLGWAMLPECSDFAEWKFGQRADGLMSSSLTFINKLGMAVGGFIASFFLGMVNFIPNQEQTGTVLDMIVFLRFGIPILGYVASLISMIFYRD